MQTHTSLRYKEDEVNGGVAGSPPSSIFATTQYLVKIYLKWIACYVVYKIMLISWENGAAGVSDVIEHVFFFRFFTFSTTIFALSENKSYQT